MLFNLFYNRSIIKYIFFIGLFSISNNISGQFLQSEKRVIFFKETSVFLEFLKDTTIQRFTPNSQDIDSTDIYIEQYFHLITTKVALNRDLDKYYRQYVGFWIKGNKCIYINASCIQPNYFFKNTYYPKGDGKCYFRALADLNNKIIDFNFNSPK